MAPEYRVWRWMRSRCLNPNNGDYHHYGGRGIRVCAEWLNDFAQFLADVGPRPSPKHEIDRIDVNGDYEKSNVRCTDRSGQMNNTRCNRRITFQGRTQTLTEWGRELGISPKTLRYRLLAAGWPVDRAFGRPVGRWVEEDGTPPVPHDPETGRFATGKARPTPDPPKAPQLCLDL